ncbi:scamp family-domain-containing protein [Obelidium mucronatum]|nr:scamp family-domain-containing protein [Obelidium mucronatum]
MSNPFDDENPFSDPSITQAASKNAPIGYAMPSEHVVRMEAAAAQASVPSASGSLSLAQKEADLRRREEALAAREQEVLQQEAALRAHGLHPPNWPPFYPLIYHDIDTEVPAASRPTITKIYNYWLSTCVVLAVNMVACLSILASHSTTTGGSDFGGALIYCFTISALSFFAWYRPIYTAFSKDSSLFFYIFLLFEGLHILFAAYMTVGLPGSGSAGIINLLSVLTDGKYVSAVFCILATAGWGFDALFGFWLWVEVNQHVKRGGHSLDSARAQAVQMGVLGSAA